MSTSSLASSGRVLVMGAGGGVGRLVLTLLVETGAPVRASMRRPRPEAVPAGVDLVGADLTDPASLKVAFADVEQVFLYATPHAAESAEGVVMAAADAGVRRMVLMSSGSVLVPTSAGNTITQEHREVEDAYTAAASRASGIEVVAIHPLVLASNALGWAHGIRVAGTVSLYGPEALNAPVHEDDVAAIVVAALGSDDEGATSSLLTGPERLTQRQQVQAIAAAVGRDLRVRDLTREEALAHYSRFTSTVEAEAIVAFLDDCAAGNSPATDTVERVLGRPALTVQAWASDHAGDFR